MSKKKYVFNNLDCVSVNEVKYIKECLCDNEIKNPEFNPEIPEDFMVRVGMMNPMYMPRIKEKLID